MKEKIYTRKKNIQVHKKTKNKILEQMATRKY